uniref:Uncharacterized protein n=1 Tax=Triticum urartu TaxID=4572 RepID=A0A8R7U929_TRIUA
MDRATGLFTLELFIKLHDHFRSRIFGRAVMVPPEDGLQVALLPADDARDELPRQLFASGHVLEEAALDHALLSHSPVHEDAQHLAPAQLRDLGQLVAAPPLLPLGGEVVAACLSDRVLAAGVKRLVCDLPPWNASVPEAGRRRGKCGEQDGGREEELVLERHSQLSSFSSRWMGCC